MSAARRMSVARTPEEDDFLARSARHLDRQRTRARVVASIVAVAIVAAGIMSAVQWRSASEARNREATARQVAETRALVSEGQRRTQDGTPLAAAITLHGAGERASDPEYRSELLDRAGMLRASAGGRSAVLPLHGARVNGLAWSPSGHRVATGDADGHIHVWSPDTLETTWSRQHCCRESRSCTGPRVGTPLQWRRWTTRFAYSTPRPARRSLACPMTRRRPSLRYLPDGRLLTAKPDGTVLVQPSSGSILQEFTGHEHYVFHAAVHESTGLLTTASVDKTARIWDLDTGDPLHRLDHPVQL